MTLTFTHPSKVVFTAERIDTRETVAGYYFANQGVHYITEMNEEIQPPLRRMHKVYPETIQVIVEDCKII